VKILIVHNPKSGQGDSGLPTFVAALELLRARVTVRSLEPGSSLIEMLSDARDFDRVVAAGGDGTVGGVAHVLAGSGVPILAYPSGTANWVSKHLGLPSDPAALALMTVRGNTRILDLGELEFELDGELDASRIGFAMGAGAGIDASIMAGAVALKPSLGISAYFATGLTARTTVSSFRLELDGERFEAEGIGVMIVNIGRILELDVIPGTDSADGWLDVAVITARSSVELVPIFARAIVERIGLPTFDVSNQLQVYRAREVRLWADPPLPVQFDGEVLEATTPITVRVRPGAAVFIVSSTLEDAAPSASENVVPSTREDAVPSTSTPDETPS
jgi:diacylglycerol kinase family enzyme